MEIGRKIMKHLMRKRAIIILVIAPFIIALTSGLVVQPVNGGLQKSIACSDAFDQLFTAIAPSNVFTSRSVWMRIFASFEIFYHIPQILPLSEENRAPPA